MICTVCFTQTSWINAAQALPGDNSKKFFHNLTAELQNVRAAWRRAVDEYNLPALYKATYTYYEFCDFTSRYLEGAEA